jgi:hypothetical protein
MQYKSTSICLIVSIMLFGCVSPMQKADQDAKLKQANTAVEEKVLTPFDEKQAKAAMQKGDATIKGVLYHKVNSYGKNAGNDPTITMSPPTFLPNVKVWLLPATDHLAEYLRLEKENQNNRARSKNVQLKHYILDERVFNYMQTTQTDASGRYFFKNVKSGRYYVLAQNQNIISSGSETVLEGMTTTYNRFGIPIGSIPEYRNQDFRVKTPIEYGEYVEIKSGQKDLTLESRMRFNPSLL